MKSSEETREYKKLFNNYFPPGWLHKEMKNSTKASLKLKKRWFLLTHNSLDYYKSSERNALKLGTLVLNSLCSVVQPDEKVFKETGKRRKWQELPTHSLPSSFNFSPPLLSCQDTGT